MKLSGIKLIIFDLDGTLVDAYPAIIKSFNFTMARTGCPARDDVTIRRAVGWGDRNLLKPFVAHRKLDRALAVYRKHHAKALALHSRLLPGAGDLLALLKKQGFLLAVASNRPTRFSHIILKHLGIRGYFDMVLCGDRVASMKPHPQILRTIMARLNVRPRQTMYVGDMTVDARTGRRAKVRTVLVPTGSSSRAELKKEHPAFIITRVKDLRFLFA